VAAGIALGWRASIIYKTIRRRLDGLITHLIQYISFTQVLLGRGFALHYIIGLERVHTCRPEWGKLSNIKNSGSTAIRQL